MSKAIVSGNYGPRDTVKVDVEGDDITFERIPAPDEDGEPSGGSGPVAQITG